MVSFTSCSIFILPRPWLFQNTLSAGSSTSVFVLTGFCLVAGGRCSKAFSSTTHLLRDSLLKVVSVTLTAFFACCTYLCCRAAFRFDYQSTCASCDQASFLQAFKFFLFIFLYFSFSILEELSLSCTKFTVADSSSVETNSLLAERTHYCNCRLPAKWFHLKSNMVAKQITVR